MSEQTTAGALRYIIMSAHSTQEQKNEAREALKSIEAATLYQRGDLVWCRRDEIGQWERGIVTDVFLAPMTGREVVVVNGNGYYDDDVCPDPLISVEPQSIRA